MTQDNPQMPCPGSRQELVEVVDTVVQSSAVEEVVFAQDTVHPPVGAYFGYPRLFVMVHGCRRIRVAQNKQIVGIDMKPRQAFFAGASAWHATEDCGESFSFCAITFHKDHTVVGGKSYSPKEGQGEAKHHLWHHIDLAPHRTSGYVVKALTDLADHQENEATGRLLFLALLRLIRQEIEFQKPLTSKSELAYQAICNHVQENFQEPINRESVAHTLGLHPNHISRLFHEYGDGTFTEYITSLRMEQAVFLRRQFLLSVKELSQRCGFENSNYFGRVFRRYYGTSPGRLMK